MCIRTTANAREDVNRKVESFFFFFLDVSARVLAVSLLSVRSDNRYRSRRGRPLEIGIMPALEVVGGLAGKVGVNRRVATGVDKQVVNEDSEESSDDGSSSGNP